MPLKPDPTFYPSPASAMKGPPEELAYVVTLNTPRQRRRGQARRAHRRRPQGRLVDARARSSAASTCPTSATSCTTSAGTPARARCARGRRTRTSSAATCWSPACARAASTSSTSRTTRANPKLVKVIEAEELARRTGYSRPHTVHCGPDGLYMSALGNPDGDGPGGVLLLDHDDFSPLGAVGDRPRPAEPRLRRLVEHRLRHAAHQRVGHAEHGRGRPQPRALLGQYGHHLHVWDLQEAPPQAGDRPRRRAADGARAAPRARPDQALRVRRRRRLDRRPQRVGVAVGAPGGRHRSASRRSSRSPPSRPRPSSSRPRCSRSAPCRRSSPTSR